MRNILVRSIAGGSPSQRPATRRAAMLGGAAALATVLSLVPLSLASHGNVIGLASAFAQSTGTAQNAIQSTDDMSTGAEAGDDNGVDAAEHDVSDDKGVYAAGHDAGDDNGVDAAGHDAGDDNGGMGAGTGDSSHGGSTSGPGGNSNGSGANSGRGPGGNSGEDGHDSGGAGAGGHGSSGGDD
jgi:hypothetical protein